MGYIRKPCYFKEFQCIGGVCSDSCCIGWEIDVDEETLRYYQQVPGAFGKRLKDHIMLPSDETDEQAHFIQGAHERCPFLNECNLCDIFIELGEEHLSQICTHHPRYYDWFLGGSEAGLGLCCEEAARLILEKREETILEEQTEDENEEENRESESDLAEDLPLQDEELVFEKEVEEFLFQERAKMFQLIRKPELTLMEKMDALWNSALIGAETLDEMFFGSVDDEEVYLDDKNAENVSDKGYVLNEREEEEESWTDRFWKKETLLSILQSYRELEINDMSWWTLLGDVMQRVDEILLKKDEFLKWYEANIYEYEQLLEYFLFRHFMKSREDIGYCSWVTFALISTSMILLLDIDHWNRNGNLTIRDQINICKLYSKEIEYDEDNTRLVSDF